MAVKFRLHQEGEGPGPVIAAFACPRVGEIIESPSEKSYRVTEVRYVTRERNEHFTPDQYRQDVLNRFGLPDHPDTPRGEGVAGLWWADIVVTIEPA